MLNAFENMNLSDDEYAEISRWMRLKAARGHATLFARSSDEDLAIVERSTAREWSTAVREKFGQQVSEIKSNPEMKGVPDCFARLDGETIGIELTELVDGDFLNGIRTGRYTSAYEGSGFFESQWDQARFHALLTERLRKKQAKYARNSKFVEVLIVHTDEPWLLPCDVEQWLAAFTPPPTANFGCGYFLMTYVPGYSEHWPVFRLF